MWSQESFSGRHADYYAAAFVFVLAMPAAAKDKGLSAEREALREGEERRRRAQVQGCCGKKRNEGWGVRGERWTMQKR